MGTRGTLKIIDKDGNRLVTLYKHWDSYPEGWGAELYSFCEGVVLTNGIKEKSKHYNGIGCFAASLIAHFKIKLGDLYVVSNNEGLEEYNYTIKENQSGDGIILSCKEERNFGQLINEFRISSEGESSVIEKATYSWPEKLLFITFKGSGKTYRYAGVPSSVYSSFLEASSKGSYFNTHIKSNFTSEEVS